MASQQLPGMDEAGVDSQPEEDEIDDALEMDEPALVPAPEPPISDRSRDRAVLLIAILIGAGALVVFLGLNFLAATGILGSGCELVVSSRTAQCYSPDNPDSPRNEYVPSPVWFGGGLTLTVPISDQ
ncbi:MAG: hypothetical protein M1546_04270 [Chloroflexi bacterium]|nr:hypothetical protein [Chloroflexota bacterium]